MENRFLALIVGCLLLLVTALALAAPSQNSLDPAEKALLLSAPRR